MKYSILSSIVALSLATAAQAGINMAEYSKLHPAGFGIQIAGGGLDLAYYTANHDYVIGVGGATFKSEKTDKVSDTATTATYKSTKEVGFTSVIFVRKNIPMTERLNIGFAANAGKILPTSGDTRGIKKSFMSQAYISAEYAVSDKLFLYASLKPVKYKYIKETDGNTDGENTNNISIVAGGSVQLTYLI